MISERKLRRFQLGLLLAAGALFAFYWVVYRSLGTKAGELDQPVVTAWKRLVQLAQTNANVRSLEQGQLKNAVQQMQQAAVILQASGQAAKARVELDAETRTRLVEEFQLLEFDRSRFQTSTALRRAAEAKKVQMAEAVLKGLPEFDPQLTPPALHWAQLAFARQMLAAAVAATPRAISNLTLLPVRMHMNREGTEAGLIEFPMRLELAGSAVSLMTFLSSLPLRTNELATAGLAEISDKTQPLFIDRLILRNASANPGETALDVVVTGFCELRNGEGAK
jgi:hypothetical protein